MREWVLGLRRVPVVLVLSLAATFSAAPRLAAVTDAAAARALGARGAELAERGDFQGAQAAFDEALSAFRALGMEEEVAATLGGLGAVAAQLGHYDKAVSYFQQALAIFRKVGAEKAAGMVLNVMAEVSANLGEYDQAVGYYEQALAIFRKLGMQEEAAGALGGLGDAARDTSRYDQAMAYYEQALAAYRKLGMEEEVGLTLKAIGLAAGLLGQYDNTLDYCEQALAVFRKLGMEAESALTLRVMGLAADGLAQHDRATGYDQQALTIYRKLGMERETADTLRHLGAVTADPAKYDRSVAYYEEALAIYRKLGLDKEMEAMLSEMGLTASPESKALKTLKPGDVGSSLAQEQDTTYNGGSARPSEAVMPSPESNPKAVVWRTPAPPNGPQAGDVWVNPKDGMEMVYVPEGEFTVGTSDAEINDRVSGSDAQREPFGDEQPQCRVRLQGYWISRTEVTNAQYQGFARASGHRPPSWFGGKAMPYGPDHCPVVFVNWEDARAYCEWAGGRLPTELEWEKAARGTDGRVFPWGNEWDGNRCLNSVPPAQRPPASGQASRHQAPQGPAEVGTTAGDTSPYGCRDTAGNVCEWCADWYDDSSYQRYAAGETTSPEKSVWGLRVIRGGAYTDTYTWRFACSRRPFDGKGPDDRDGYPEITFGDLGFRYVRDAAP